MAIPVNDPGWHHTPKTIQQSGLTTLYRPGMGEVTHINLDLLTLPAGKDFSGISKSRETVLIVLSGTISGQVGSLRFDDLGKRADVFDGKAEAVYIGKGDGFSLTAVTDCRCILASCKTDRTDLQSRVIRQDDVRVRDVGRDNWQRTVHDIIPGDFPADTLIIGETYNPPGNWSSYPPHKHDKDNPPVESQFEELYFYKVSPSRGFGIQRIYTAEGDVDVSYTVSDNDLIEIPRGYHPVIAGGGYQLYYLWVLAGKGRSPVWFEDPSHSWIKNG